MERRDPRRVQVRTQHNEHNYLIIIEYLIHYESAEKFSTGKAGQGESYPRYPMNKWGILSRNLLIMKLLFISIKLFPLKW